VEQHGGTIHARSDGPRQGSTFEVRLPVASSAPNLRGHEPPRARDTGLRPDLTGSRVLVVDDQPDSRVLAATLLETCGADVLQCDAAPAALGVLDTHAVHLLVADIAMPSMDGYELIARAREAGHTMPAVAVSAYARPEDRERALSNGFAGYVAKPIDAPRFLALVAEALSSARPGDAVA
jgi:CheY-like chemotaxis protein